MGLGTLPLTPSYTSFSPNSGLIHDTADCSRVNRSIKFRVSAKQEKQEPNKKRQSLFSSVTEALDFSQVRSEEDAQLIEEAREATRSGERMSREQVYSTLPTLPSLTLFIIPLTTIFSSV